MMKKIKIKIFVKGGGEVKMAHVIFCVAHLTLCTVGGSMIIFFRFIPKKVIVVSQRRNEDVVVGGCPQA